ncbi:MAG: addiction module toxin, HicA family [Chloroflexi bacterium]|nr:addiction module toxin, HicA family [Chloroflexota bacterium]
MARAREVIRALERLGWVQARQEGSHVILRRDRAHVTVPAHRGDIPTGTLRNIARQAGLSLRELRDLL